MDLKNIIDGIKINFDSMPEADRRKIFIGLIFSIVIILFIGLKIYTTPETGTEITDTDSDNLEVLALSSGPDTDWLDGAISSNSASQRKELKNEIDSIKAKLEAAQDQSGEDIAEIKSLVKSLKTASDKLAIEIAKEGSQRRAADKMLAKQIDNGISSGNTVISGLSASRDLETVNEIADHSTLVTTGHGTTTVTKLNPFDMFSLVDMTGVSPSSLGQKVTISNDTVETTQSTINAESNSIDRNGNVVQTNSTNENNQLSPGRETKKRTLVKIPSGSLIKARLVTGLNAVIANTADTDKMFIVAKLTDPVLMPNRKKVSLRGCVIMGGAKGDLSTERVYINSTVLSCISSDDVLYEGTVQSNAIGEDGVVGLRGRPVTKDGALILQSSSVGLLQGFAQTFSESSNRPQIVTGSDDNYQLPKLDYVAKSSAASGIDKGLDQLLKRANSILDQIFPVLEVDAGRKVEFVVQNAFEVKEI